MDNCESKSYAKQNNGGMLLMMVGWIYDDLERLHYALMSTTNEKELNRIAQEFNSLLKELENQGRSFEISPIGSDETKRLKEEISKILEELK